MLGGVTYRCECNPRAAPPIDVGDIVDAVQIGVDVNRASKKCFPGAARVHTLRGEVQMANIVVGDALLTVGASGKLEFSKVHFFTSCRPQELATFIRLSTNAGINITVTPSHYLFSWPASAAAAAEAAMASPASWPYVLPTKVAVGDFLPVATGSKAGDGLKLARVVAVERVQQLGVFMPHTLTGAIVVDGVAATELTSFVPPSLASHRFQAGFTALMRLALKALPASAVDAAVTASAAWVHGTAPDQVTAAQLTAEL